MKLTSGVIDGRSLRSDGFCANVTDGLAVGGETTYSETFVCDIIGRVIVVVGTSTEPQSLSICELAIYGNYIGGNVYDYLIG